MKKSSNYQGNGLDLNEQQMFKNNSNNNNSNNNDIHDFGSLGGAPLALGASSGGAWKGATNAPTMVDAFGLSDISAPQPMAMQKGQQTAIRSQAIIMPKSNAAFSDLNTAPLTFGDMKPKIMVLPSVGIETEPELEFKSEPVFFVPSKCIGLNGGGLQPTPAMYNEMTSVVVDETPQQVLNKFKVILNAFSNDIEFTVDEQNYIINGQIFIRHFAVFFKISIWTEQKDANRTRFEFRRSKGDTVGFTEFWNEIEEVIYKQFTNVSGAKEKFNDDDGNGDEMDMDLDMNGLGGLPPLDYNFNLDLDDSEMTESLSEQALTAQDLDNFIEDMEQCDPSVVYSIAMLLDAFQAQTSFLQMVFKHTQFLKCIIDSALRHQDAALVRGALLTLERLCDNQSGADNLMSFKVLDSVVPLLHHQNELIRKYAIRVLAKLSSAKSWKFANEKLRNYAQIKVKECESQWKDCKFATNDFIQQQMFVNIHQKLIKV